MKNVIIILICFWLQTLAPVKCLSQNYHNVDLLITKLNSVKEDTNKAKLLIKIRDILFFNDLSQSNYYNKKALALSRKLDYKPGIINSYVFIASNYMAKGDFANSLYYFNKLIPVAKQSCNSEEYAYIYNGYYSGYFQTKGDYSSAMNYSNKTLQIAEKLNNTGRIVQTIEGRATIYRDICDYPTSINYFLDAIKIDKIRNDILTLSADYYRLGVTYNLANDNKDAIDCLNRSYKIANETDSRLLISIDQMLMGELSMNGKQWDKARDYFQQSITINQVLRDSNNMSIATRDIAIIYCEQGLFDKAIKYASNALQIAQQTGDKIELVNSYKCLGEVYMGQKNYSKAISYLKKGLELNITNDEQKSNQSSIYDDLAKSYAALNNYRFAFAYSSQYSALEDSILNEENVKKAVEMGALYNSEKNEKEIALLTKNEEIQNLEIKKQGILQKSLLAGMALMLILFFFIYRSYHTRQLLKLQTLRNKIASDLHDDIGSTLSSISIFTLMAREGSQEVIPMLDQIGDYSRNMLESMADIVWNINPNNDNFEKIILRMRSFAFELLGAKNIDFEFNADESLSHIKLSMELRKNLYLIFKEATNNMVKYSQANSAIFSITRSKNILTLLIRDNGKGFDVEQETQGNGLKNMRNRAMEMGATFLIESEPGKGTTIQLLIKAA